MEYFLPLKLKKRLNKYILYNKILNCVICFDLFMEKYLYILLLILVLTSCDKKYALIIREYSNLTQSFVETKPTIIKAPNDSIAYIKAYEHYCYYLLVKEKYSNHEKLGSMYIKLLDEDYNQISNHGYLTQTQKDSIYNEIKIWYKEVYK